MMRCLLFHAEMPAFLWDEAADTAAFTLNRVACKANEDGKTPYVILKGKPPNVKFMRVMGCRYWAKALVGTGQKLTGTLGTLFT